MIHLLFTGGTISMSRDAAAGGNIPTHGGAALVSMAPDLGEVSPFTVEDWGRFPAAHLGPERLWALRNRVRAIIAGKDGGVPDGVVITHGTDTMEETAYLLARTLDPAVPVVLTGAMHTSSDFYWDGPRNLTDAARVAADPGSRGRGAMIVFAGKILAGHQATKVEATALDAFGAPHGFPLGRVDEHGVQWTHDRPELPGRIEPDGLPARVALIPMVVGDQGTMLDLARPAHDGVVLEAFGSGNLPPGALPAIRRWLEEKKPVVLASRCARGAVLPVYAFEGGGAGLVREGVIPAGPRTPAQARLELALALSAGVPFGAK
ncbi:MAG TPA: asparaginase [Gemmatimonadales bacterium]|nr:asparaginase [Gemmatimonadales bacterium]